ncbi:MAG: hydrogenase maturation nickel metallochaperone HypA [Syntrophobacteraceae bacterium]
MHELSVISSIHQIVLKHAAIHKVRKITAIHLEVGAFSDLEDQWMQHYFDFISKGGIAEGARLVIERPPAVMGCADCGASFEIGKTQEVCCPQCGSKNLNLVSGRQYLIKNMEAL